MFSAACVGRTMSPLITRRSMRHSGGRRRHLHEEHDSLCHQVMPQSRASADSHATSSNILDGPTTSSRRASFMSSSTLQHSSECKSVSQETTRRPSHGFEHRTQDDQIVAFKHDDDICSISASIGHDQHSFHDHSDSAWQVRSFSSPRSILF